jgi:hypothetical protein
MSTPATQPPLGSPRPPIAPHPGQHKITRQNPDAAHNAGPSNRQRARADSQAPKIFQPPTICGSGAWASHLMAEDARFSLPAGGGGGSRLTRMPSTIVPRAGGVPLDQRSESTIWHRGEGRGAGAGSPRYDRPAPANGGAALTRDSGARGHDRGSACGHNRESGEFASVVSARWRMLSPPSPLHRHELALMLDSVVEHRRGLDRRGPRHMR